MNFWLLNLEEVKFIMIGLQNHFEEIQSTTSLSLEMEREEDRLFNLVDNWLRVKGAVVQSATLSQDKYYEERKKEVFRAKTGQGFSLGLRSLGKSMKNSSLLKRRIGRKLNS